MKRVRFIVTGDLERIAIVGSISRLFPAQTVEGEDVVWLRPRKVHGATSHRLRRDVAPSHGMKALARALIAEAWEGSDGKPADLVIALDDVEVHNFGREQLICDQLRAAIDHEFLRRGTSGKTEQRVRARLQERCSLHLLRPMAEAYFFPDKGAMQRAGCAADVVAQLVSADVEDFECCDVAWLPHCAEVNARMAAPPLPEPWWREERHAKHYLEHLVERAGGLYDEVVDGAPAFANLAWAKVPSDGGAIAFMRALFEDLADFFGLVTNPLGEGTPSASTYPERHVDRARLTLRNL